MVDYGGLLVLQISIQWLEYLTIKRLIFFLDLMYSVSNDTI